MVCLLWAKPIRKNQHAKMKEMNPSVQFLALIEESLPYWSSYLAVPGDLVASGGVSVTLAGFTYAVVKNSINPPKTRNTGLKHTAEQLGSVYRMLLMVLNSSHTFFSAILIRNQKIPSNCTGEVISGNTEQIIESEIHLLFIYLFTADQIFSLRLN